MSLAPGLLIAAPPLSDPNFDRSVVLLAEHNEKGAFGWVINGREIMSVDDLFKQADFGEEKITLPASGVQGVVRLGGPVGQEQVWLLYPTEDAVDGVGEQFSLAGGVTVSPSQKVLRAIADGRRPKSLFAVIGYAGWGPDQLENEIKLGAWLPTSIRSTLVFEEDPERMWVSAYEGMGTSPMAFTTRTVGSA